MGLERLLGLIHRRVDGRGAPFGCAFAVPVLRRFVDDERARRARLRDLGMQAQDAPIGAGEGRSDGLHGCHLLVGVGSAFEAARRTAQAVMRHRGPQYSCVRVSRWNDCPHCTHRSVGRWQVGQVGGAAGVRAIGNPPSRAHLRTLIARFYTYKCLRQQAEHLQVVIRPTSAHTASAGFLGRGAPARGRA